jgi:gliding motility-associated-like protein
MNFTSLSKKLFTMVYIRLLPLCVVLFTATAAFGQGDNACQAVTLTPDATCTYVQGTNVGATASSGSQAPACANFTAGTTADVWYRATVPAGGALTFDMQAGSMTDGGMAVYRGSSCNALILLPAACDDNSSANPNMPKLTVSGLVPASTVYVRVWSKNGITGTFGICATIPVPPPANDEICSAIELPVAATCNYQTFTNASASLSSNVAAPVCAGFLGGDVWFKVIVPAGTTALVFDTDEGVVTDGGMAVYTGSACTGVLTQLACDDNSSVNGDMPALTLGGFTPGDTVWVRFWEADNNNNGTFGICVTLPPPPPVNDDPCTASLIPVEATCNYQTFTNQDALNSAIVPDPGCGDYQGGDVWFKLVVPAGGRVVLDAQTGVMTDGAMAVYRGVCNNLELLACNEDASVNGAMPSVTLGGLTEGDTLWVRFWEEGNNNNGTFGICASIPPPAPTNDDPCTATEVIANTTCTFQTFTNAESTGSTGMDEPGCADYQGSDVWFKVVVPAGGALIFDSQTGVITDGGMALYTGTCDNLTLLSCDDDASNNGAMPFLTENGLTPGDTIWIRFWEFGGNNNGTFGLCVKVPPPPPAYDDPCNGVILPVEATCNYQIFTNESSTDSPGAPDPSCAAYQGSDVWFKVVVPAGGAVAIDTDEGEMTDGGMSVYTGTCDGLIEIACDDNTSANGAMPKLTLGGLNPGDTLYVRVWSTFNDNNGTFGICANIPPPPPANDDPCGAIVIPVEATCTYQTFSNEDAIGSVGVPAPGCAGYQGSDVWFKAVVPAGGAIVIDTDDSQMTDGGMALYSGACGSLSLLTCDDNTSTNGLMPKITAGGLTPGDTIYIRMWSNGNDNNGTFGICATIPPPPPANDNPCTATSLTPDSVCTYQTFTNENATNTLGVPAPGCALYEGSDVWFSVVVPSGGALIFDTEDDVITDGGMAIYSGRCDSLTLIDCDDDASNNGLMPFISAGGLTPGDTIWVRVWEFGNDNNGTFGICVRMPPPGPVNDDPCGATLLPVDSICTYQTFTNESSFGSAGVDDPGCGFYQGGDVWFKAVVPADGAITFDTQAGVMTDGGMAVYTGTCNNLTLVECDEDDGAGNMPKMTIGGFTAGDTVWVRVWEEGNNNNGTFGICLTIPPPPPGNDNPCGAISIPVNDTCLYQNFSNEGSFGTASVPDPGCGNYQGSDVWFQLVSPASGAFNVNTVGGTIIDAAMAIYTADSCNGTLTLIACDDNASGNPDMPYITATGIFPGTTVYVRVWSNGGTLNAGTFGICAVVPPLQPATFSFSCARDTSFSCGGGDSCFTLQAIIPDIHGATDRYAINPLSSAGGSGCFNPYIFPGGEGPSADLSTDDVYTDVINLPFSFPFFGANYNSLVASTNGYVSFDVAEATNFSHWDIVDGSGPRNLPTPDGYYDRAVIMGPYHDLNPFYNTSPNMRIKYNVTGTAPHRRWILSFYKVPLFQAGPCDTLIENTHQIVLYECSGVVEVFIFDMQNCLTWNEGRAMVGMQDFNRTRGIMAPGRAATDAPWGRIGMNESWRFVPIGGPTLFKRVELFDTSGNFLATGDTTFLDSASLKVNFTNLCALNRLPAGLNTLLVRAVYQNPCDPTQEQVGADTITIFIPNLKVNFDVQNGQCGSAGSVSIHAISGVQPLRFSVDSGTSWQADSVFTGLVAGTYYVKVQDAAGCSRDTIVNISSLNSLAVDFTVTNALCNGGTGTVSVAAGGVRPIRYSSDSGTTYQYDSTFTLLAGTYNFHIVDTNGCFKDSVIVIGEPLLLSGIYVDSAVRCNGNADGTISVVSVTGGTAPFTYSFDSNPHGADSTQSNFAAGPHTVSIRDANGCTKDTVIIIADKQPLSAVYADSAVLCGGSNGIISVVGVSGGTAPYTYSFDSNPYSTDTTISSLAAGLHTVSIKDANGCIKDTSINVLETASLQGIYVSTNILCNGSANGVISVTAVSGGTAPYTYSFDNATYAPDTTIATLSAGPHTVSIRDANGCTKDTTIIITQPGAIVAAYTVNNAKCFGATDGSIVIDVLSGGTGGFEYSSNGGASYQVSDSFALGAGTYVVRIRDANGCTKDTSITISQPSAITATYTVSNVKCFSANSGSIVITASGGTPSYEYSINGGGSFQLDDSFAVAAGTYVVRIRDANGCTKDTSITITQPDVLSASASAGTTGCSTTVPSGQVTITATGGTTPYTYSRDGVTFQNENSFTGLGQNSYTITVKDDNGCTVTTSATVGVANDLTLQTRQDTTLCGPAAVVLNTNTNAQSVSWSPTTFLSSGTAISPTVTNPTATTQYVVTAQTGDCVSRDTVNIVVTLPPSVDAGLGISISKGQDAQLSGTVANAANFAWTPTTYISNPAILNPVSVMPQQTITYTLTATNAEGCTSSDTVTVTVLPYCIKVKNAFTPNNDGVNDTWMVYDQFDCLKNVRVQVFNRYGSRVFESQNYRNDWRGTYGGSTLPDATYYYVVDFFLQDGRLYQVRGDVTILR